MATTSIVNARNNSGRSFKSRFRAAFSAVACTAALSTVATLTPTVANADEPGDDLQRLTRELTRGSSSISDVAGAIADVQGEISRLEGEIGRYREIVNQALVDLQDARTEAQQARDGAATAKEELNGAQVDVEKAQEKLDEISRSVYRRSGTSDAVTNAAGADARAEKLERQSYLAGQSDKQRAVVEDLEKVRTQKANKESQLRLAKELADQREERATSAEEDARKTLEDSLAEVEKISAQRDELTHQEEDAQDALDAARGLSHSANRGTENADKDDSQSAASGRSQSATASSTAAPREESTSTRAGAGNSTSAQASTSESASASESSASTESAGSSESAEPTEARDSSATSTSVENAGGDNSGSQRDEPTVQGLEPAQRSGADEADSGDQLSSNENGSSEEDMALLSSAAMAVAQGIVAGSQPVHTQLEEATGDESTGSLPALQGDGQGEQDADLTSQLGGVLEELETSDSVTEEASDAVSDMGREAQIEAVIARAESQIGVPYAWGGGDANGPTQGIRDGGVADSFGDYNKVGFDCSGLVLYAFASVGISLPHFTGYQYNHGEKIPTSEMERGDLIFYGPNASHHVAIYLGDGMMLEAPQSGQNVQKSPVRYGGMAPYAVRLI
ncbi:DIP1281 family NlpC/P60 protein [Corynebacterium confusum]|uniref:DIP1281 family NlpC/P60 protein n=1 Tax=Corynebacterium confusum TaxID=71254 RepID=UPI003F492F76|nr:Peptidoglycan endopeptidase RipA precursor [Corynebacterium confusum]